MNRSQAGFTLLELLVTVALVAILAAFAIPSFRTTMQNNQLVACANKISAAVQLAKSEAVTTRRNITVAGDGAGSFVTIQVGADPDGDGTIDDLIQRLECEGDDITLVETSANASFFSFGPTGFRSDGQGTLTFLTCNSIGNGKVLNLSNGGGVTSNDAPNGSC
jgi:prepilin-type N-terminal cleavage/methylation domain-containing protein